MTMFQDSVNKKMYAIDREGQYLFDFGHAEQSICQSLTNAAIALREGASDEKRMSIDWLESFKEKLEKGELKIMENV